MNSALQAADLATLPSETLTARLGELLGDERALLVQFLLHLGELERRRLTRRHL